MIDWLIDSYSIHSFISFYERSYRRNITEKANKHFWSAAVIMLKALQEFTLVHVMSAGRRQVAADLWTKQIGLNHRPKPACRLPVNYTHHRHFIITQPESWYSFYHPTEGRRLSRPSWLATYRDGLPARTRSPIQVLTGPGVQQLRWSRPTRYR